MNKNYAMRLLNHLYITQKEYFLFFLLVAVCWGHAFWECKQQKQKLQSKGMQAKQAGSSPAAPEIIEQRSFKGGSPVVRQYHKRRFLGKGGFAKCFEVEGVDSHRLAAMKIISKETLKKSKAKQKLVTEIKIHKALDHRNVVAFDHVFQDTDNVYMVLELCTNHTLNQMLKKRKRISELQTQYFLQQIVTGLSYVHQQKVIHRDLKLGNIMLNQNMEVKIGDFGLAAKLDFVGQRRKTICGTPNYLAPEIIANVGHSYEVDIWSLGVVVYTLLYGRPPFETSDVKKTYKRIRECQYTFNEDIPVSANAKNLIAKLLMVDPSKRLTLDQVLVHPFMTANRIPKQMPASVLTQPLPRSVSEQYVVNTQTFSSCKLNPSAKTIQSSKAELQGERAKSQKGISERLLLRTATGLNRNLFYNKQFPKEDYQLKSNPQLLSNNFLKPDSAKQQRSSLNGYSPVYVKKWVDYSSKYGLGYLLSDGSTGIYFNDASKMVLDDQGQKVDYISNESEDPKRLLSFPLSCSPDDKQISKKLTLMQYFRKYLHGSASEVIRDKKQSLPFVYIKRWAKSDQAIAFRLNNKVVQVNFNDKSQLILYCQKEVLLYSNSQAKEKMVLDIASPDIKKNTELAQRFEHAKVLMRKLARTTTQPEQIGRDDPLQVEILHS